MVDSFASCCYWMSRATGVATVALGSRPRQGLARLRAKREAWEWRKVWGNEPSHSQRSFHFGSWTPECSENDCKGQNPMPWRVLYTIGKILKCRCLKWVHITHLDIWNTSYGPKKGRESNWHFDSRPLKVKNWPDFLGCRWRVTTT
jgi:hypothetical protein